MSKKSSKLDKLMFQQVLDELGALRTDELLLFFKEYSRKNKEFKMDLLAYFAPKLEEKDALYELILRYEYGKIMRQSSNKISKSVRKIFGYIEDFCFHIEDQIALKNHCKAMQIILACLRYSSKVLYRVEANDKLISLHLRLHDILAVLIEQIEAAQLKEELFDQVAEIASAFYYYPSSSSNNLFALLVELKNYGHDLEKLLIDKYQASQNSQAKSILGVYIIMFYQDNFDIINEDRIESMKSIIVAFHEDHEFIKNLCSGRVAKPLPLECETYLLRVHVKSKPNSSREFLFKKLFLDVDPDIRVQLTYEHLRSQYSTEIIEWIEQTKMSDWKALAANINENWTRQDVLVDQMLSMRLIRDVIKDRTKFFDLFRTQFSLNMMKMFGEDLFEMDANAAYQLISELVISELNLHIGEKSIYWTNDILRQLFLMGRRREAERLRAEIQSHYGHRKQLAKALV